MAIYDNSGTTSYEIGKLYDNDGTTSHQIGKAYDNYGTVNSLIYSAESQLFPTSDDGKTYNSWDGGGVSISDAGYIQISLSTSDVKYNTCNSTVNLTGYDYINFTVSEVSSSEGFWCNIGVSATKKTAPEYATGISNGAGTYSVNVSELNGEYYIQLRGRRGKYDGKAFFITNIWLS